MKNLNRKIFTIVLVALLVVTATSCKSCKKDKNNISNDLLLVVKKLMEFLIHSIVHQDQIVVSLG